MGKMFFFLKSGFMFMYFSVMVRLQGVIMLFPYRFPLIRHKLLIVVVSLYSPTIYVGTFGSVNVGVFLIVIMVIKEIYK